ncbi:MAG: LuxR C-terminal-related transcriptional regulator [Prevotellaceae bacterium]|jgi:DNA-binding NarL/FixJ family response regulator|nr:LuxR C-terminal-related transcriptional regulator [Prevotellaceae bacterium]
MTPEIAIIDPNTLSCMGLESLLEEIIPQAVVRAFRSFEQLTDDTPDMYVHYFVAAQIYFEHTSFFLERKHRTIVLTNGSNPPLLKEILTLDIFQDEQKLIKDILYLHRMGHQYRHLPTLSRPNPADNGHELTSREIEVLILVTSGLINKEIADKLNISLTTVISHRKNITEKLGIKSVAGLTIYAVVQGYLTL